MISKADPNRYSDNKEYPETAFKAGSKEDVKIDSLDSFVWDMPEECQREKDYISDMLNESLHC